MIPVAVWGASGYAGGELVRLIDGHPDFAVAALGANRQVGARLGDVHPHLEGGDRVLEEQDVERLPDEVAAVFLALPHGASAEPAVALRGRGVKVIDLGSDFRMDRPDRYEDAYGAPHPFPEELARWPYGLPELNRDAIVGSGVVAVPGCYPTATLLGLAPLVAAGVVDPAQVIVSAVSGVSGAGRKAAEHLTFGAVDEGVTAYAVGRHRHRPEMEQGLEMAGTIQANVTFTPHLVPMQRGILATIHAPLTAGAGAADVAAALDKCYAAEPFVDVIDRPPQTRWVVGSNRALVWATVDRTGQVIVLSAIDNLLKGAAGQAVQCANLMFGLAETAGLPRTGFMP